MHETAIASSILATVLDTTKKYEANEEKLKVSEIILDVGVLACLEPITLQGCFEIMAEGTAAENALLTIEKHPMKGKCPDCGAELETRKRFFSCPKCSGYNVNWQGGNEMQISSIRVEADIKEESAHE